MGLLKSKIQFYNSMAMMHDAGLPILKALSQRHPHPFRKIGGAIVRGIEKNSLTMSEQMRGFPSVFDNLECEMVMAGEQTGKLDVVFKSLAEWFELQRRLKGQAVAGMIYPVLLYHFAAIAIPFIAFSMGGSTLAGLAAHIAFFLAPPYLLLAALVALKYMKNHLQMEPPLALSTAVLYLPWPGNLIRKLDYARFFGVFNLALEAGMPIVDSIRLAASACRNGCMRNAFRQTAAAIEESGCKFNEAFSRFIFPADRDSMAVSMMETAELSGKTGESSGHIAKTYRFEAEEELKLVAGILPKIIYIGIVVYLAITIISFWSGIYSNLNSHLEF